MGAQNLSNTKFYQWRESFARLESRFEAVFTELRSIRSAFEARPTLTSPPPMTAPAPPLISATTPPYHSPLITLHAPTAPKTTPTPPPITAPVPPPKTTSIPPVKPTPVAPATSSTPSQNQTPLTPEFPTPSLSNSPPPIEIVAGEREWRPPWLTADDSTWIFILEDKDVFKG